MDSALRIAEFVHPQHARASLGAVIRQLLTRRASVKRFFFVCSQRGSPCWKARETA